MNLEKHEALILDIFHNFSKCIEEFKNRKGSIQLLLKALNKKNRKLHEIDNNTVIIGKKKKH